MTADTSGSTRAVFQSQHDGRAARAFRWAARAAREGVTRPFIVALFWIVAGLALVFATLYANALQTNRSDLFSVAVEVSKSVGIALILFGVFNVMIDTRDWRKYFEQRVRSIVIEQSYLDRLDKKTLIDIHTRLLKARLGDSTLDREGTFLSHFNSELVSLLSRPYRERVHAHLLVKDSDDDRLYVVDRISYVCRKMGKHIQPSIPWATEHLDVEKLVMRVRFPDGHASAGTCDEAFRYPKEGDKPDQREFDVDIASYADVDGLFVEIEATYFVDREGIHNWTVPTLTHGYSLTIDCPDHYVFDFSRFVRLPDLAIEKQYPGSLLFHYPSWMLPNDGIAWSYHRLKEDTKVVEPDLSETARPAR